MKYVVIFPYIDSESENKEAILMVEKQKPAHLKGFFNLVGGKIEEGETPEETTIRELREETGLNGYDPVCLGEITGSWGTVYCVKVKINTSVGFLDTPEEEVEKPFWTTWSVIKDSSNLIPNLRIIIPLMMSDVSGWKIEDENNRGDLITMGITLQTI